MEQARVSDRRTDGDRRIAEASTYTGPERRVLNHRRSGIDRRNGWPSVCVYCGEVCGGYDGWSQMSATIETKIEFQTGICTDCSSKRFPQFYTDS